MGLFFLGVVATVMSIWLMLLILVQRGKGGGLTGALGGMGGQSAFGSKAGDVFTKITVVSAIIWMTACLLIIRVYNRPIRPADTDNGSQASAMSAVDSDGNYDESVAGAVEEDPLDDLPGLDDGTEEGDNSSEESDEATEGENDPELNGNQDDETESTDPETNEGEQSQENESDENETGSSDDENKESSEDESNQGEGGSGDE